MLRFNGRIILIILILSFDGNCKKLAKQKNTERHSALENEIIKNEKLQTYIINHDRQTRIITEIVKPNNEVECNLVYKDIMSLKMKVKCEARDTLIHIHNNEDLHILPNHVYVKRCVGYCNGRKYVCRPKEIVMRTIHLQIIKYNKIKCTSVTIPEHNQCDCTCKEKHCYENQYYDYNTCSCRCQNQVINCGKKMYDNQNCSCKCRDRKYCSTGSIWNEEICGCVQIV